MVIGAPVGQPVDQPGIRMEGEDNRLVRGEQRVESGILQTVRVLGFGLQSHQVALRPLRTLSSRPVADASVPFLSGCTRRPEVDQLRLDQ